MGFETSINRYSTLFPLREEVFIRTVMKLLVGDMKYELDELHGVNEFENALRAAWEIDICQITIGDDETLESQVTLKQVQDTIMEDEYLLQKLKEDMLTFSNQVSYSETMANSFFLLRCLIKISISLDETTAVKNFVVENMKKTYIYHFDQFYKKSHARHTNIEVLIKKFINGNKHIYNCFNRSRADLELKLQNEFHTTWNERIGDCSFIGVPLLHEDVCDMFDVELDECGIVHIVSKFKLTVIQFSTLCDGKVEDFFFHDCFMDIIDLTSEDSLHLQSPKWHPFSWSDKKKEKRRLVKEAKTLYLSKISPKTLLINESGNIKRL